jgi:predicted kinase
MKTKVVYLLIGTPGCGKSTWISNQNFPSTETTIVSMDDIREELTGDTSDQSKNAQVASIAKSRYEKALENEVAIVVWDATNAQRKYRRALIDLAKNNGYEVVGVWFDIPLELSKIRNKKRKRVVPDEVIDRMYKSLKDTPPSREEGFDIIQKISQ